MAALACPWWRLDDAGRALAQGESALQDLPRADDVTLLLDPADLSWHRVSLPRIARSRWPQALAGLLEDRLLDDPSRLHIAVDLRAGPAGDAWAAAVDRAWLQQHLQALQRAGLHASRAAPLAWPTDEGLEGHFDIAPGEAVQALRLTLCSPEGVTCLPLAGSAAAACVREMLQGGAWPASAEAGTQGPASPDIARAGLGRSAEPRWTALPVAAQAAERFTGQSVVVVSLPSRVAQALASPWNLLQFDLAPRRAAMRGLAQAWSRLRSPAWQPVRWGLAALAGVQLIGVGTSAWQAARQVEQRHAEQAQLLRQTFPEVKAVLDAPAQMQRMVEPLRRAAGQADPAGFERAIESAAAAWPAGAPPASRIDFDRGRLQLATPGWSEAQQQAFARALGGSGWAAQAQAGAVVLQAQAAVRSGNGAR